MYRLCKQTSAVFSCEGAALEVLMSVSKSKQQSFIVMQWTFRLCAFLVFVSKSMPQGHTVMQGTFRLCAFLFYVSKSKPQGHIVMQGTFRLCALCASWNWNTQGWNITVYIFQYTFIHTSKYWCVCFTKQENDYDYYSIIINYMIINVSFESF